MASSSSLISNNNSIQEDHDHQVVDGKFIPSQEFVLQKHAAFFDRNHDGIIYPWETFQGCRAIGCGIALSTVAAIFINVGLSSKTRPGKFIHPLFPIEIKNIHLGKHGSDSGTYDTQGRFVGEKFEEIFKKHAKTNPEALTSKELDEMLHTNRLPKDYPGWIGAFSEWKILYLLAKDKNGLLHKDKVRGVYDGTLFEQMEKEHSHQYSNKKL
ncbi:probable peroxygenase 4 isoform X2 [Cannabis sativa]|uniref:probable peroxygenase 4 isoform X2 n=1 Tax=Cannabis sativa TaxID=3483 RepID=UPI0029C9C551|nr:probable peroxygenase 4 isoform X2 [Cannabis sativa]